MDVSQAIRARRSVRRYQPGVSIPKAHIEQMLEAAMCAPSAVNSRPWEYVVVESADTRAALTRIQPYCRSLPEASLGIVVCGLPGAWPDAPGEGFWPQDCGAAVENLLLEATGLGYGTCWCGLYPNRSYAEATAQLLGVTSTPVALVIVGKAAEEPTPKGHFDPAKVRYLR